MRRGAMVRPILRGRARAIRTGPDQNAWIGFTEIDPALVTGWRKVFVEEDPRHLREVGRRYGSALTAVRSSCTCAVLETVWPARIVESVYVGSVLPSFV